MYVCVGLAEIITNLCDVDDCSLLRSKSITGSISISCAYDTYSLTGIFVCYLLHRQLSPLKITQNYIEVPNWLQSNVSSSSVNDDIALLWEWSKFDPSLPSQ